MTISRLGIAVALFAASLAAQTTGASFGSVVNLGGSPSDSIYSINSTANRVDVLSLSERKLMKSITVGNFPLAAALSPDNGYL